MDFRELLSFITQNFSSEEVEQMCMELGVDYANLPGTKKPGKARELVKYMMRRGRLPELEALCLQERPFPSTKTPSPPQPSTSPTPQPKPSPQPIALTKTQLNPYTLTSFLHIFFDDDEQAQLAKGWGEEYGRFHPTPQNPLHPLVEKLTEQEQLDQLLDAARQMHPELPWSEAVNAPGLIAGAPPKHHDTKAMIDLLSHTFPNRAAFDSFFRQQLPQFLHNASSNSSPKGISLELVQYMERRNRLPELLTIMQTAYPAEFDRHGPYHRIEKAFEKQKREAKEKLTLSGEAAKVVTKEIIRREAAAPNGLTLRQTLHLNAKRGIKSIAWLPQQTRLLSVTFAGALQAWNITEDKAVAHYQQKRNEFISFIGSMPNEKDTLIIVGPLKKKEIRIQNLVDNKLQTVIEGVEDKVNSAAISPDGEWAVTAGKGNSLQVWNLVKAFAETAWRGHLQEVTQVVITPDGKQIISGSKDETIKIWDTAGELQHTLTGHTDEIALLAVSPDGRRLVSVQKKSSEIFVWDLRKPQRGLLSRFRQEEPQLVQNLGEHKSWITALSFSANGRFLATKSLDYTVRLWQCDTWHVATQMMETRNAPIAFHPKRPFLATGGENGQVIRIWEMEEI